MAYKAVKCPSCGAAITSIPDRGTFFCQYCGAKIEKEELNINISGNVTVAGMASVSSLLERGYMFLEDGEFKNANSYFERVLDVEPKCSRAYLGKLLAQKECRSNEALVRTYPYQLERNELFKRALRFANEEEYNDLMALKNANLVKHQQALQNAQNNINKANSELAGFERYFATHKYTNNKYTAMMFVASMVMAVVCFCELIGLGGLLAGDVTGLVIVIPFAGGIVGLSIWIKSIKKRRAEGERLEKQREQMYRNVAEVNQSKTRIEEMWNEHNR